MSVDSGTVDYLGQSGSLVYQQSCRPDTAAADNILIL